MASNFRILIIGRDSAPWAQSLGEAGPEGLELDDARLPAAGIRRLDETPPDAVLLVDEVNPGRLASLVGAIRSRPLGALTPIVVVGRPDPSLSDEVEIWLEPGVRAPQVLATIGDALGVELTPTGVAPAAPSPVSPAPSPFVLEEIPEPDPTPGPRRLERSNVFGDRSHHRSRQGVGEAEVDEATLRRKLKAVRHEDYFAILEAGRGSETPQLREAFYRQIARFDPERVDFQLAHQFHGALLEIRDALEDAWAVLGDPELRAAYLEQTTRA